jgi:dipeptidyl aminopeptidase/acylaminoacyl peptidase
MVPVRWPSRGLSLVLVVHGGPWSRDTWGYHPVPQWLANRGYAVLQVNFRGSAGFGKRFLGAANREWGGKMHDDLVDAVKWAVNEGIADPTKVCIYGSSHGGYAALVGAAFTPDLFQCAVDVVGPSNLVTLLKSFPAHWSAALNMWWTRVGHPEKDREFLESRSPLFKTDRIGIPLLIAHGANDTRVKQSESDRIVETLRSKKKEVEYLVFPDEGHNFARPENRMALSAAVERFLARHLGGRAEPPSDDESKLIAKVRK